MSDQLTSQSRSNASGITRRTALRGAAWSASAVTVVVAAPAYATSHHSAATASTTNIFRSEDDQNVQLVTWVFTITAGATALTGLTATFSGIKQVTGLEVKTGNQVWTGTGTSTRSWGTLAADATLTATAVFTRGSNGTGTAVMSVKAGSPSAEVYLLAADYT